MTSTRCQRIGKRSHPKAFFEFWNLMSFYGNRVSAWCYNNPLENRLMRWFMWVPLRGTHSTYSRRHNIQMWHLQLLQLPLTGNRLPFSPASMSVWGGWKSDMPPSCPYRAWNRDTICLSHWTSLLERQQGIVRGEQMMCCEPPAVWPLTAHVL